MIVLDTHVWVWWLGAPRSLTRRARRAADEARAASRVYVSSISVWEVALLVSKGRLQLTMKAEDWLARSEALPFVHFVPVDNTIALKSVQLPGPLHADPCDRIIIATAKSLGATLITKDEKIRRYPHVSTLW